MNRPQLKSMAKQQLQGNLLMLVLMSIIMGLLCSIPIVNLIAAPALTLSLCMVYLKLTYGNPIEIGDLFNGLSYLGKAWWLSFLIGFFTFLWSLLFLIPGIIKTIAYSMAPFVLADNPNLTAREALDVSKQITEGHKMDLFILGLSFLGWLILIPFTFGIAAIWVVPYMTATYTNAYQSLKNNP